MGDGCRRINGGFIYLLYTVDFKMWTIWEVDFFFFFLNDAGIEPKDLDTGGKCSFWGVFPNPEKLNFKKNWDFLYFCVYRCFDYMCVCPPYVSLIPEGVGSSDTGWLWGAVCVLGVKPGSFARSSALNHISPAPRDVKIFNPSCRPIIGFWKCRRVLLITC